MFSSTPAFTQIRQMRVQLALASGTYPRARSAFWEGFCGKISMHDAPTHVHLSGNGPLPHSRLVQCQKVLIARIPLVSTDLLLAFRVGQASKLSLLLYRCLRRFWPNLGLGLASFLSLRTG